MLTFVKPFFFSIYEFFKKRDIIKNRLVIDYIPDHSYFPIKNTNEAVESFRVGWDQKSFNIQERVYVIFLNPANKAIGSPICFHKGGVCETVIDMRIIFSTALACLANGLIIAHNHPSGDITPSDFDVVNTENMKDLCKMHNITLFDHIILSDDDYFSFRESGLID